MTKGEVAKSYFLAGKTCSQAVMLAFREEIGLNEELILRLALPFGGGMGRLRETCGAFSGAVMCLGLLYPGLEKREMYVLVQELGKNFSQKFGSRNCGALLTGAGIAADASPVPEARTAEYYRKRPCPELIAGAADLLQDLLSAHPR